MEPIMTPGKSELENPPTWMSGPLSEHEGEPEPVETEEETVHPYTLGFV
jgi:hypothetical protein